jgi:hypothetical protein
MIVHGSDAATGFHNISLRINGDAAVNYYNHFLVGNGSTVTSSAQDGNRILLNANSLQGNENADTFGASVLDILDFSSTSKNTTVRELSGIAAGGSENRIKLLSAVWLNTAAVTSFELSTDFLTGTRMSLYGVK